MEDLLQKEVAAAHRQSSLRRTLHQRDSKVCEPPNDSTMHGKCVEQSQVQGNKQVFQTCWNAPLSHGFG